MNVSLHTATPDPERVMVEIARVSSSRENKREDIHKLINYLIKHGHWSPFEHSHMTVEIVTSRAIAQQILRHWSMRFQEFSQRYAKALEVENIQLRAKADKNRQSSSHLVMDLWQERHGFNFEVFDLPGVSNGDLVDLGEELTATLDTVMALYQKMLDMGIASETARMILPLATQTTIYVTGNCRSWIHFLQQRDDEHAQLEVQLIAKKVKALFCSHYPYTSKALGWA